jgi:hypothetical protein
VQQQVGVKLVQAAAVIASVVYDAATRPLAPATDLVYN